MGQIDDRMREYGEMAPYMMVSVVIFRVVVVVVLRLVTRLSDLQLAFLVHGRAL